MKDINIKNLAELAKLSLTEGELNLLEVDVLKVLNAFEAISTVDTSNLEPMFNMVNENMNLREDKSEVWNDSFKAIELAPDKEGHLFKVPVVIKGS